MLTGGRHSFFRLLLVIGLALWTLKDGKFELAVEIPVNTRATIRLPKAQLANVTESGAALANGNGITHVKQDGDAVIVDAGSGQYRFAYAQTK
jgi:alpha-L-rhamnosidase